MIDIVSTHIRRLVGQSARPGETADHVKLSPGVYAKLRGAHDAISMVKITPKDAKIMGLVVVVSDDMTPGKLVIATASGEVIGSVDLGGR